jgi:hypothetical protein
MDFDAVSRLLQLSATPERSEIIRAKRAVLAELEHGPRAIGELEAAHRRTEGAEVNFGELQLADMSEADVEKVLGRDNPQAAGIRARAATEIALAELVSGGAILGLAPASLVGVNPDYSIAVTIGSQMFSRTQEIRIAVDRPVLLATRYATAYGVDTPSAWRFDADGLLDGLEDLALDKRTNRCAQEAFRAYVRGAFLATASLLGAVVEGAWYAVGERRRNSLASLPQFLDRDQTAQLQKEICAHFRDVVKANWRVDDLERDAPLFREIRNYGIHPRSTESSDVERHLHEDTCGLLLTLARDHLVTLAAVDGEAP